VHYPWHPAHGRELDVQYREVRRGEVAFVCVMSDGSGQTIPAWAFDAAACAGMTLGTPRVSLQALDHLRAILREVGSDPAAAATIEPPQESADAAATAPDVVDGNVATKPSPGRPATDAARREEPRARRRASGEAPARGGATAPRKRGGR